VDLTVARRRTCDREICKKPLARRTRWAMGFAWVFRGLFVELLRGAGLQERCLGVWVAPEGRQGVSFGRSQV
jgi:hypothetical protein